MIKALLLAAATATISSVNPQQFSDPPVEANANYTFEIDLLTEIPNSCVEAQLDGAVFVIGVGALQDIEQKLAGFEAAGLKAIKAASGGPGKLCQRTFNLQPFSPDTGFVLAALRQRSALIFRNGSTAPEDKLTVQFVSDRSAGDILMKLHGSQCVMARALWWLA